MASLGLRECDLLEGATIFTPWKCRHQMLLEEVNLWCFVDEKVTVPTDPAYFVEHNNEVDKVKKIILDFVKVHFIPHSTENFFLFCWLSALPYYPFDSYRNIIYTY